MAGLFEKQAATYAEARPQYPKEWFAKLASLTARHELAWDAGTGNGQAAVSVAEHYEQVIATDVSEAQLKHAIPHPKVRYVHTPLSTPEPDLVSILGGEGSVDLVTVAQAVHWFDLPSFYSIVHRVLRKPGGVIAVWGYNYSMSPLEDVMKRLFETTKAYWDPRAWYAFNRYRTLPFPFKSIGLGSEGAPMELEMEQDLSFDAFLGMLKSWSAVTTAKERGVDLLSEGVVKELETAWGGPSLVRRVTYKAFMLAGTPKMEV
ncbi:putative methyltransferase DDB_G0268948 [Phoenix dactylifera]|uniref:Methyltransferase DDB_G0268948 n=1 Tax=Phoenix dactylifera TaxID=42345 RepID=A0A8B9A4S9_PHODC|nr:putative methyltransferase DDB_G0268948 [Phoenix dactylifera]